jgi:membrane protease YdiL (CAAX protease family)
MKIALFSTALIAGAVAFSLREATAGSPALWLGLGLPYAALSVYALYRMYDDGTLLDVLRFRAGDVTIGFVTAGLLFGGAWLVRKTIVGGGLSLQSAWLLRIALELGTLRPSPGLFALIAAIAILEELVWRGLVLSALSESLGTRRAWPATALAYSVAHVATLFTLSDPSAGPNPLLVVAALGCGLVWSFMTSVIGRLPPAMISHAVFSYFAVALVLPRLG